MKRELRDNTMETLKSVGLRAMSLLAVLVVVAACSTAGGSGRGGSGSGANGMQGDPVPGTQQDLVVNVGDRIFFDLDRSNLRSEARDTLQRQSAWLKMHPEITATVEGHCDERGTREHNLALGARRANAVKDYLVSLGVDPGRLRTISYGKERPVALCSNESCWGQNRRGVSVVNAAGS